MIEWLQQFWESLTWSRIIWGAVITIISVVISYIGIIIGIIRIPADYFSASYARELRSDRHFSIRWTALIVKNIIGAFLIIAGIIMIFTPGPGVPTILLGLIMMDIPGKRPLEARLIGRPAVLSAVNDLRARYNKPPLIMD
jgi:multisubunit Na+/H+ antiporter MnhG subunit